MRKYQQLLLVIISFISVSILLVYKSENNRLKYVLQVINFFGRNDASVLSRLRNGTKKPENFHEFAIPLPVWQRIGENFHIYSAFWNKKELTPGGEAIGIVTGSLDAIINFRCALHYDNDRIINGKFAFITSDDLRYSNNNNNRKSNVNETFNVFKFLCKVTRNFGIPESVIFSESKSKISHEIILKHIHNINDDSYKNKLLMTVCLNLVPYDNANNSTVTITKSLSTSKFLSRDNLIQFFMHHQAIGIDEFLVYDSNRFPLSVRKILSKAGIQINYIPYNFPYDYKTLKTNEIIEYDCLMRNINLSKYTIILKPNEFLYPNMNIQLKDSVINSLKHYENDIKRFEIQQFSVCLDYKNKLLIDNTLYDPESKSNHKIYIYKPFIINSDKSEKSTSLLTSKILAHNYINCISSKDLLYDWRNSVREDFMQYIKSIRNEISFIF